MSKSDQIDLPTSVVSNLEQLKGQIEELQRQYQMYLQGAVHALDVDDLSGYRFDAEAGALVRHQSQADD